MYGKLCIVRKVSRTWLALNFINTIIINPVSNVDATLDTAIHKLMRSSLNDMK